MPQEDNNQEQNLDQATVGRVLHFVIDGSLAPKCRPAFVLEDWAGNTTGTVNLAVFPDGSNDGKYGVDDHVHQLNRVAGMDGTPVDRTNTANVPLSARWETSVLPNHNVKAVRSWHWPRECSNLQVPETPWLSTEGVRIHHNHSAGQDLNNCSACLRRAADIATTTRT